jgi:processive 1,2-diacylglycerol beta-glucosyltransferase
MRLRKKRILLLSEGFGAGHTQAAHALAASLRQTSPHVQTRVLELGSFLHPMLAPWILNAYRVALTSQPKIYGMLYRHQYDRSINRFAQLALHRLFYAQTQAVISRLKPDMIICTHPFPSAIMSRLKRGGHLQRSGINIPLCTVITDYDAHGNWVSKEVDQYFVSTDSVKDTLLAQGIAPEQVNVTGIPVHPSFLRSYDKEEIRRKYGLQQMPTVMIMGGGWGLTGDKAMQESVAAWREQLQFIFCMGSNAKAAEKLSNDPRFQHPNVKVLGFTKDIGMLMEVSDLLITKPGGMTCTEGFAKGIPMLFYKPIPGQEEGNLAYFTEQGLGEAIESEHTIDRWFRSLAGKSAAHKEKSAIYQLGANEKSTRYRQSLCSQEVLQMLS